MASLGFQYQSSQLIEISVNAFEEKVMSKFYFIKLTNFAVMIRDKLNIQLFHEAICEGVKLRYKRPN